MLKTRAVQTLRDCRASLNFAKRLECGAFTTAFGESERCPQVNYPRASSLNTSPSGLSSWMHNGIWPTACEEQLRHGGASADAVFDAVEHRLGDFLARKLDVLLMASGV